MGIFLRMNLWIFAGVLGIFVIGQVIVGLRWWLLLRTQSIFINFWAAVRLHFLGLFYNNFMPSSIGGDLVRAWYVTRHTEKKFAAVLSVFVDRAIGLLSTLLIAIFFYSLFLRGEDLGLKFGSGGGLVKSIYDYKLVLLLFFGFLLLCFLVMVSHEKGRVLLKKFWSSISCYGFKIFGKFKDSAVLYCKKPAAILAVLFLTFFIQIMIITSFWYLGFSLGIDVSVKYYYVFFTLTWVLGAVPISIGGAVVVEGLLAYMFVHFAGVQSESALALALCQRVVWMLSSLPGGLIHLLGAHLPKEISIDYEGGMN